MAWFRTALLALATLFLLSAPALAQPAPAAPNYNVSWSALDPGNDWSAQIIQSVFPVSGTPPASFSTGSAATVVGTLVGTLTGFVSAIAMAFLCYCVIMQIHRGAESGRILSNSMTSMFVVRIGVAAILMYPLPSGFSAGQKLVVQTALWGAGMARTVYNTAVQAVGPDAMVIAEPIIPGTKTIVLDLIQAEMCRALVNAAAANPGLVPAPRPATLSSANSGYTTWSYGLSAGNGVWGATCGTVTVRVPPVGSAGQFIGVNMDMAARQQAILTSVVQNDIRPAVESIAQQFWTTKQQAALTPLQGVLTNATADYTQQLTAAATAKVAELRSAMDPAALRNGDAGRTPNMIQLSSLGWTAAGSYYLEFARLNGLVLSLMSAVPTVNTPNYRGLGPSLTADVAPLADSMRAYLERLKTYVQTTDGIDVPGGNAELFSGASPGDDGAGIIEKIVRGLHLSDRVLGAFTDAMSPTGGNWTDPFAALTQLGHKLILASVAGFGLAGLMNSTTGTLLGIVGSAATGNFGAAGAIGIGSMVMGFLATPVFALLMGILVPGLMLAFVIPMIPWVMWMAGVTGWIILVCEAVIAVPLWMLAHMTMSGEGLHGRANEGYSLLFNVLFRPTLMILGLFLAYFIFGASSWLIRVSFGIAAGFVLQNGWLVTNILGVVVLLAIFVLIHIVAAVQSFRMITLIPHHLPRLIGFGSAGRVDMEQFAREAALVGVGGTIAGIRGTAGKLAQGMERPRLSGPAARIAGPASDGSDGSGGDGPGHGMDSTLRAATDNSGPNGSEEA